MSKEIANNHETYKMLAFRIRVKYRVCQTFVTTLKNNKILINPNKICQSTGRVWGRKRNFL